MSPPNPRQPQVLALLLAGFFLAVSVLPPAAFASAAEPSPEAAPKAYLPHGPISIGSEASFAAIAAAEGWPGDGSQANPYVISGYEITTGGTLGHAIYIKHQSAWVVIRDNYIHDTPQGIRLQFGANAIVTNNVVERLTGPYLGGIYSSYNYDMRITNNVVRTGGAETGITVEDYGPSTITGNTITGGRFGIRAWSNSQAVTGNSISGSSVFGIWDFGSVSVLADNTVSGSALDCIRSISYRADILRNTVSGCGETGVRAPDYHYGPTILGENVISSSPVGLRVDGVRGPVLVRGNVARDAGAVGILLDGTKPVTVTGNVLENRTAGIQVVGGREHLVEGNVVKGGQDGLLFHRSINNTVAGNRVTGNERGITLNASEGNLVHNNLFANGRNVLVVNASDNRWNITKTLGRNILGGAFLGGNAWSDYSGVDADLDGLGDVPHGPVPYGVIPRDTIVEDTYAELMPYGPFDLHPLMSGPVATGVLGQLGG